MSRTGATPSSLSRAWRSGRRIRKSEPKMSWARGVVGLATRLEQADLEHLARVVPLVHRGVDVETLVALEADQPRPERRREDLGELGLADTGLALQEEWALELEREEHRGRERAVRDVVAPPEVLGQRVDRARAGWAVIPGCRIGVGVLGHGPWMLHDRARSPASATRRPPRVSSAGATLGDVHASRRRSRSWPPARSAAPGGRPTPVQRPVRARRRSRPRSGAAPRSVP